jgi:hypothetical protein
MLWLPPPMRHRPELLGGMAAGSGFAARMARRCGANLL